MTIELSISGIESLIIKPNNPSKRVAVNWISLGDPTSRGVSTTKGVSGRTRLFTWNIYAWLRGSEVILLERIIDAQQERLGAGLPTGIVTLSDRVWDVNPGVATQNGRTIISGSDQTVRGQSGKLCQFKVMISSPETANYFLKNLRLNDTESINFIINEVVL
jgi:hypothetical protein